MGRTRRSGGPMLMVLWAIAPPMVVQTNTGEVRFSVGAGGGVLEEISRSCEGNVLSTRAVEFVTYGARLDVETTSPFRATGFAGVTSIEGDAGHFDGTYQGLMVAMEWDPVGLGLGYSSLRGGTPIVYTRLGRLPGHLRVDVNAPSTTPGVTGLVRIGAGFRREGTRGFVGFGFARILQESSENGGPFVDLEIPLSPALDLTMRGSWHFPEEHNDWGAAIGGQYRFRR